MTTHAQLKASVRMEVIAANPGFYPLSPQEVEFLACYREQDQIGKRRLDKAVFAAKRGELPSAEVIEGWSAKERDAFLDSLPEPEMQA